MSSVTKMLVAMACGLALTGSVRASVNDAPADQPLDGDSNPYGPIWLRNVFDLKPAPPPVVETTKAPPPEPPPNVKLTGITTIFGTKQALFLVQPPAHPGKPPEKEISYMLKEGDRRGGLEVMEIQPKTRLVTIKVDDVVSTITFPTNAPTGGMAGAPGGMRQGQFAPPGGPPPNFTPPGVPGFQRPMRAGNFGNGTPPQANNNYNNGGNNYSPSGYSSGYSSPGNYPTPTGVNTTGGTGVNLGGSSFTGASPQLNAPVVQPILTAEQQQVAITLQHQALMNAGTAEAAGMASILPPVPGVTDNANESQNNSTTSITPVSQIPLGSRINGNSIK